MRPVRLVSASTTAKVDFRADGLAAPLLEKTMLVAIVTLRCRLIGALNSKRASENTLIFHIVTLPFLNAQKARSAHYPQHSKKQQ
jgi:hypothetical protein